MTAHQKKLFKKYCKSDSDSDSDSDFDYDEYEKSEKSDESKNSEEIPLTDLYDLLDNLDTSKDSLFTETSEIKIVSSENTNTSTFQQQIAQNIINTEVEDKQIENLKKKAKIKYVESLNLDVSENTQSEIQLHPTIVAIQEKSIVLPRLNSPKSKKTLEEKQQHRWNSLKPRLKQLSDTKFNEVFKNITNINTKYTKSLGIEYLSKHPELWSALETTLKNY